jgi:hypothetical protein
MNGERYEPRMPVINVDSTVRYAALPAVVKYVRLHFEQREWYCFLSLRDPAALPGRPGHPPSTRQTGTLLVSVPRTT